MVKVKVIYFDVFTNVFPLSIHMLGIKNLGPEVFKPWPIITFATIIKFYCFKSRSNINVSEKVFLKDNCMQNINIKAIAKYDIYNYYLFLLKSWS